MRGTILVVDDEDPMRQALRRGLSSHGYVVVVAHDVASALYAARKHNIDFALVDQSLTCDPSDCSGLTLAPDLLLIRPSLRIVVFTAYANTRGAFRAGRISGVVDYLRKPSPLEDIIAKLEGRESGPAPLAVSLDEVTHDHALRVLTDCEGNYSTAAKILKVTRDTLRRKLG